MEVVVANKPYHGGSHKSSSQGEGESKVAETPLETEPPPASSRACKTTRFFSALKTVGDDDGASTKTDGDQETAGNFAEMSDESGRAGTDEDAGGSA